MFLRYLSDFDYEPDYWPFVLRMETLIDGFVKEAARHVEKLTEEQARNYFENCFAVCFSTDPKLLAENWWGDKIPPIDWFWSFFDQEFPYMLKESQRRARLPHNGEHDDAHDTGTHSTCSCGHDHHHEDCDHEDGNHEDGNHEDCNHEHTETESLDRDKVRLYAHEYEPFRLFLQAAGMDISQEQE